MNAPRLFALVLIFSALSACGRPESTCVCGIPSSTGKVIFECGDSRCVDGVGFQCASHGQPRSSVFACPSASIPQAPACTRKTCASANTACGPVSDGCGGMLECGTCSGTNRCMGGQCLADPCAQAHAVCGTIQGTSCGTCPGTASCSVDQRQCIEKVATLTGTTGVMHGAVAGNSLYLSLAHANDASLVDIDLTTGTQRELKAGELRVSPLTTNGSHLSRTQRRSISWAAASSPARPSTTRLHTSSRRPPDCSWRRPSLTVPRSSPSPRSEGMPGCTGSRSLVRRPRSSSTSRTSVAIATRSPRCSRAAAAGWW